MPAPITTFNEAVSNALLFLQRRYPFWSFLLYKVSIVASEAVPTASINANGLVKINPGFLLALPLEMQAMLLAHEVAHLAFGIFWRGANHDRVLSNQAHDYVVNWMLHLDYCSDYSLKPQFSIASTKDMTLWAQGGGASLKDCAATAQKSWVIPFGLLSEELGELSYEEVYALLASREKREQPDYDPDADWSEGGAPPLDANGNPVPVDGLAEYWRSNLVEAAERARAMGRLPHHIDRAVNSSLQPRVNWTARLAMAVKAGQGRTKRSLCMPSRRPPLGDFISGREYQCGTDTAVAIDTSASISPEELERAIAEASGILRAAGTALRFISCDADVGSFRAVRNPRDFTLVGGGGTDFSPVFRALERRPPKTLVYFTDLQGTFPDRPPRYNVIWAIYDTVSASPPPFGTIVRVPVTLAR